MKIVIMCKMTPKYKCKIILEKFHFDILCLFGVIKESLSLGGIPPGYTCQWTKKLSTIVVDDLCLNKNSLE